MEATIYSAMGILLGLIQKYIFKEELTGEQKATLTIISNFLTVLIVQVALSLAGVQFVQDSQVSAYGYTFAASQLTHLVIKYLYPKIQSLRN